MDNVILKERAKISMGKSHWLCVGIALLGTITIGAPQYTIEINTSGNPNEVYDSIINAYREFFSLENIVFMLVMGLIGSAISFATKAFLTNQLYVGGCRVFLKLRKNNRVYFSEIIQSYKDKTFLNIAKVTFFRDLYVFLWSLLFLIPGIIKSYEYFAVDYILAVRPDIDKDEALNISKKIMYGHKGDLFVLNLSFLGWIILSCFLCAIPYYLYVLPYMRATLTEFYSEVRLDAISRGIITADDIPDYPYPAPVAPYNTGYGNVPPVAPQMPYYPNAPVYPQNNPPQSNGYYQQNAPYQPPYQPPYYPPYQQQTYYQPTMVNPQYNGTYTPPNMQSPNGQMPSTPPTPTTTPVPTATTTQSPDNVAETKTEASDTDVEVTTENEIVKQNTQGDEVE